jgi:hypothetical protein
MHAPQRLPAALFQDHVGSVDRDALKIPARRSENSLGESALSPFHVSPAQFLISRHQSVKLDCNVGSFVRIGGNYSVVTFGWQ